SGGSRFGGRGGGRDRDFGRSDRGPVQMHEVTCDKCGKRCEVPFKPTGDKPVYCSDCFRKEESPRNNFSSNNQNGSSQTGISAEQFKQINAKLDRILNVLESLEMEVEEDSEEDAEEDEEEKDE
ncbi:MAG: CxxC-x17-CxxC domain-containing protein, partial [Nanoarchaeota archaeon]